MAAEHILWFNPRCGTAKKALALLNERGIEPEIRLYLTQPPTRAELEQLLDELTGPLAEVARAKEPAYAELGLSSASSRDELIAAILEHPILLQRPILQTAGRAVIARPAERALELLEEAAPAGAGVTPARAPARPESSVRSAPSNRRAGQPAQRSATRAVHARAIFAAG